MPLAGGLARALLVAVAVALVLSAGLAVGLEASSVKFVVYGDPRCPHCKAMLQAIDAAYPGSLVFINIGRNTTGLQEYKSLWDAVVGTIRYAIPFTVVYVDGVPRGFIVGEVSAAKLREIVSELARGRVLYCRGDSCSSLDPERYAKALSVLGVEAPANWTAGEARAGGPTMPSPSDLAGILAVLAGLALMDSVNPCFLAFYALLVASASALAGVRRALALGLSIAAGVFTGYYLLGFGLASLLEVAGSWLRPLLGIAAALLGTNILLRRMGLSITSSAECRVCKWADRVREAGPLLAYGIGLAASWTLLPCTAGPYIAAIALLDTYPLPSKLGLLAFYNAVFITPLLLILLGSTKAVERLSTASKIVEPVAGALLVAIGLAIALGLL